MSLRPARAWILLAEAAALLAAFAGCAGPRPAARVEEGEAPLLRVGVLLHADQVQVGAAGPYTMVDAKGVVAVGRAGDRYRVSRSGDRLVIRDDRGEAVTATAGPVVLEPDDHRADVSVDGSGYPKRLEIVLSPGKGLNVVNVVDVETYLRAVVPLEIGHEGKDYLEAAKAQAVAARTYVAGHLERNPAEGYDVQAGVQDQVYGAVDKRHPDADRAVAETRGLILTYDGKPIRANYSSTCGGETAGVEESFDADPVPYLKAQKDEVDGKVCCRTSRYYRWTVSWAGDDLAATLARTVPAVLKRPWDGTSVRDVKVLDQGRSGRATRLRIETDHAVYQVEKTAIRRVLERPGGAGWLWSADFKLDEKKSGGKVVRLTAEGRGWGHGVGMCQWGAMQLSKDGYGFRKILAHYYPGTKLEPWYLGLSAGGGGS